jgi:hypothetical protein
MTPQIKDTKKKHNRKRQSLAYYARAVFCLCVSLMFSLHSALPLKAYLQEPSRPEHTLSDSETGDQDHQLAISGDLGLERPASFLKHINDIVVTSGDLIAFSVLKAHYKAHDFHFVTRGLPDGAMFQDGVFRWVPGPEQVGTHVVTIGVADTLGHNRREKCRVILDVLTVDEEPVAPEVSDEEVTTDSVPADMPVSSPPLRPGETRFEEETQDQDRENSSSEMNADISAKREQDNVDEDAQEESAAEKSLFGDMLDSVIEPTQKSAVSTPAVSGRFFAAGGTTVYQSAAQEPASSVSDDTKNTSDTDPVLSPDTQEKIAAEPLAEEPAPAAPIVAPQTPQLHDPGVSSFNGVFRLEWSDMQAERYEIAQSTTRNFASNRTQTFWSDVPFYDFKESDHAASGYYYYRVRAWNGDPEQDALSSAFSNSELIGIDYNRHLNILSFSDKGIFTEIPGAPGTSLDENYYDTEAYSNPIYKLDYDIDGQFFAGAWFRADEPVTIANMRSLNIRIRGDETYGYPIRMVIEMKYEGEIQGIILVSDLSDTFQDLSFPFYAESTLIDEVVIFIEDDTDGDRRGALYIDELFFSLLEYTPDLLPDIVYSSGPGLADEALLDKVEADTARFFFDEFVGPGHIKDTSNTEYSSIAATGFGLASLAVIAQRAGTSAHWNDISFQQAHDRARDILQDLLRIQETQSTQEDKEDYGVAGFFYHFMNADGTRAIGSEVSTVDTAILIAGALTAGEYFGGDIKILADSLYANVDWKFFLDDQAFTYHMGWKPESSKGFTQSKDGGFISDGTYDQPTDEVLLISLLALGSDVNDDDLRRAYFAYPREEKTYIATSGAEKGREYTVVNSYFGSLFTYLYAHCFFDFQALGEDQTFFTSDAPHPQSVNWWDNSVQAVQANRQFCIDNSKYYPFSYHENSWGISAVQRPDGRYEGRYGAVPFMNGPGHDGVVALYGPLSSLPFFRESEYERLFSNKGFQSLRYYYNNFYDDMYGQYGFVDSFDNKGNFSEVYLGLDQGPVVLMIENYRSDLIWNVFSQNEKISDALDLVFSNSFNWLNVEIRSVINDETLDTLDFGVHEEGAITSCDNYLKIDTNFQYQTGRLVIYTDNAANSVPFEYNEDQTNDPSGLVGTIDSRQVAPLRWVVFDEAQTLGYVFTGDDATEARMQDVLYEDFSEPEMLEERMILDGSGRLGLYPLSGRTTFSTTAYVYLGADFSGLEAQEYTTNTITIEIFHE